MEKSVNQHLGKRSKQKQAKLINLIGSKKNRSLTDVSSSDVNTRNHSGQYDLYYVLFILIMLSYEE